MESTPNPNACKYCGKVVLMKCATQDQADMCAFNYRTDEKERNVSQ